jgi:hypothetical protein
VRTDPAATISPTGSRLWTSMHGYTYDAPPQYVSADGTIRMKVVWYAAGPRTSPRAGPRGVIRISGRLDGGAATRLRTAVREIGQAGFTGSGMWGGWIYFPRAGCWTVTGKVERTSHTFRVLVRGA